MKRIMLAVVAVVASGMAGGAFAQSTCATASSAGGSAPSYVADTLNLISRETRAAATRESTNTRQVSQLQQEFAGVDRQLQDYDRQRASRPQQMPNFSSGQALLNSLARAAQQAADPPVIAQMRQRRAALQTQIDGLKASTGGFDAASVQTVTQSLASLGDNLRRDQNQPPSLAALERQNGLLKQMEGPVATCLRVLDSNAIYFAGVLTYVRDSAKTLDADIARIAAAVSPELRQQAATLQSTVEARRFSDRYMTASASRAAPEAVTALASRTDYLAGQDAIAAQQAQAAARAEAARNAAALAQAQAAAAAAAAQAAAREREVIARQQAALQSAGRGAVAATGEAATGEPLEYQMRAALERSREVAANAPGSFGMISNKLEVFNKTACEKAQGRPGFVCDYEYRWVENGFQRALQDAFVGTGIVNYATGRFVISGGQWTLVSGS